MREATLNDVDEYHTLLNCPEISAFSDMPVNPDRKQSQRFVRWMVKLFKRGKGCAWIIETEHNHKLIGSARINSFEKKSKAGTLAYELHPEQWGQGYATEALAALVDYAHMALEINRLQAIVLQGNTASENVLINNGFRLEGLLRQKVFFDNTFHDVKLFARLATDARHRA